MTETEIPEDIMQSAYDILNSLDAWNFSDTYDERDRRDADKIARALLAERRRHTVEAKPVPEGWQLVPTEITTDMMGAFHHAKRVEKFVPDIWSAILRAAPTPPSRAEVTPEWQPMSTAPTEDGPIIEVARIPEIERWNAARFLRLKADCLDLFQWRPALGAGKKEGGK